MKGVEDLMIEEEWKKLRDALETEIALDPDSPIAKFAVLLIAENT
jgi:hypothetical protein